MRKLLLILVAVLCLSTAAMADQLAYITKKSAREAVKLIEKQKYILLYCGCCGDEEIMQYVKIKKVSYRKTPVKSLYEVVVKGIDVDGNKVFAEIDLAYAHIKKGNATSCIGRELNLYCNPCVEYLEWECPDF